MLKSASILGPKLAPRLPQYRRGDKPRKMEFTAADLAGLVAIYEHEGILSDYQFGRLTHDSVPYGKRCASRLFHHGYIWWPPEKKRKQLPYNVYFLDDKALER